MHPEVNPHNFYARMETDQFKTFKPSKNCMPEASKPEKKLHFEISQNLVFCGFRTQSLDHKFTNEGDLSAYSHPQLNS